MATYEVLLFSGRTAYVEAERVEETENGYIKFIGDVGEIVAVFKPEGWHLPMPNEPVKITMDTPQDGE